MLLSSPYPSPHGDVPIAIKDGLKGRPRGPSGIIVPDSVACTRRSVLDLRVSASIGSHAVMGITVRAASLGDLAVYSSRAIVANGVDVLRNAVLHTPKPRLYGHADPYIAEEVGMNRATSSHDVFCDFPLGASSAPVIGHADYIVREDFWAIGCVL